MSRKLLLDEPEKKKLNLHQKITNVSICLVGLNSLNYLMHTCMLKDTEMQ